VLLQTLLPSLTPSDHAVYLRLWHVNRGEGPWAVHYDDLAPSAHVSRSTLKRVRKTLTRRKLIAVTRQAKRASLFAVFERPLTTKTVTLDFDHPRRYDLFTEEDRSLFLTSKRFLSPTLLKQLEADGNPYQLDLLIFRQAFGPERQKRYAALIEGQTDRPNLSPQSNVR